jgi:hypothetical protein
MKSGIEPMSTAAFEGGLASSSASAQSQEANENSFGKVVSFVNRHSKLLVLTDARTGASIAVWPAMQGRVLTSSVCGPDGLGFGWINHELIASGEIRQHINAVGGEDRIWLGPEGGQFSIFFAPGAPFDLDHWYVPAPLDTEPFDIVDESESSVTFRRAFHVANYSGAKFHVQIDRHVRLLSEEQTWSALGVVAVAGIKVVGFESENELTNLAAESWSKDTGLLSLWVLGQFQSTPQTTIILPIRAGSEALLGVPVTTDYFGAVPEDRIAIGEDVIFFKADSNHRSKLGLSLQRAKGILGSYDARNHVMTIVQYGQPTGFEEYANSSWKLQKEPYKGDVANCYNDGPSRPGGEQLGHFYELESSSPAKVLNSSETVRHVHRTIHLVGSERQLEAICRASLGARLEDARSLSAK